MEIKTEKEKVKKRLDEIKRQNAPMQKRLDEVTKKVVELENYTRELVSVRQVLLHVSGLSMFQTTSSPLYYHHHYSLMLRGEHGALTS